MNREQLNQGLPEPVRRYFEEVARMEPPDDLMHSAMAQVEAEPRANRFSLQPVLMAVGAIAAVVIVAFLVGPNLFNGIGTPAALPTPTPSATTGQPWNLLDPPGEGNLLAGAYYLDLPIYPARIDFTVPEGWLSWYPGNSGEAADDHALLVDSFDSGAVNGSGWGIAFARIHNIRVDPCDTAAGTMDLAESESVDSIVAAFESWGASGLSVDVQDVTIGGYSGKRLELTPDAELTCTGWLFNTPGYTFAIDVSPGEAYNQEQYTFLDVSGSVLVIWTTDYPERNQFEISGGASPDPQAHVEDQVDLHAILDSIVLTPR